MAGEAEDEDGEEELWVGKEERLALLSTRGYERMGAGQRGTHLETAKGQIWYRRHDSVAVIQRGLSRDKR